MLRVASTVTIAGAIVAPLGDREFEGHSDEVSIVFERVQLSLEDLSTCEVVEGQRWRLIDLEVCVSDWVDGEGVATASWS